MKKRIYYLANFLALNVLFFALYLNFIQRNNTTIVPPKINELTTESRINETQPVQNPEQYLNARMSVTKKGKDFEPVFKNDDAPGFN